MATVTSFTKGGIARLVQWAKQPDTIITGAITRNVDGVITSAPVVWPDGATGVFTMIEQGDMDTIDSYSISYDNGVDTPILFTQPTIIRNTDGAATNVPAMVVG